MVSEGSNHCHEGSCVFPKAHQSYYSTHDDPDLVTVLFDVDFFLLAALLLQLPDKLEALVFADKVGVDSQGGVLLAKLHLYGLSLFGFVRNCFVKLFVDIHVDILKGAALDYDIEVIPHQKEHQVANFIGCDGALRPLQVTREVVLVLHGLFEGTFVVIFLDGPQEDQGFAL